MDTTFPFGFPLPTAFYLTLYVLTFALHHAFMHYVLAGSLYVAATSFSRSRLEQPLAATIRDWMPFMLSAAITAGVAPLLFIQIVYPKNFYTANLLLSWRWMIVVPLLIMAFYLLYLLKSSRFLNWSGLLRSPLAMIVAASFVFVGFCWTANHLLASREAAWPEVYQTGSLPINATEVLLRMLVWIGGAFGTLAMIAGWQLRGKQADSEEITMIETRRMATMAISGLTIATFAGVFYHYTVVSDGTLKNNIVWPPSLWNAFLFPYTTAAFVGIVLQILLWAFALLPGRIVFARHMLVSVGSIVALISVSVIREAIRLSEVDISTRFAAHGQASEIGGLAVFLAFAVINGGLIALCIWIVRSGTRKAASS